MRATKRKYSRIRAAITAGGRSSASRVGHVREDDRGERQQQVAVLRRRLAAEPLHHLDETRFALPGIAVHHGCFS